MSLFYHDSTLLFFDIKMETLSSIISIPIRIISTVLSLPIILIGMLYDLIFKTLPEEPHTILVTGASSGICREVAIQYAKPVIAMLFNQF